MWSVTMALRQESVTVTVQAMWTAFLVTISVRMWVILLTMSPDVITTSRCLRSSKVQEEAVVSVLIIPAMRIRTKLRICPARIRLLNRIWAPLNGPIRRVCTRA